MSKPPSSDERTAKIRERARHLWQEAGRPDAGAEAFEEEAAQLIAIEQAPHAGTIPLPASLNEPEAEPIEAIENQGEFPTLTDQGEESSGPVRRVDRQKDPG